MPSNRRRKAFREHPRARSLRFIWRVRGVLEWLAQKATPKSWWNRRTVPGAIVVATNSPSARRLIDEFLTSRFQQGLFGVNRIERLPRAADEDEKTQLRPLVDTMWHVDVNRGTERAVLRDLEYVVGRGLAQGGGYAGIEPRLSIAIARRTIAAHRARRVLAARAHNRVLWSAPVAFEPKHERYVNMITRQQAPAPARQVTVAILDSAFDVDHLEPTVDVEVEPGVLYPEQESLPYLGHGAVTASIIGSLAPKTKVVVYPVVGGHEIVMEKLLYTSIDRAVTDTKADAVVMCLQLPEHDEPLLDSVTLVMRGVGERTAFVGSSGNKETAGSLVACFPGRHRAVMMVGAVDSNGAWAEFSCYDLRDREPPGLFIVAPGGAGSPAAPSEYSVSVGGEPVVGTSVAAAYAAGVVARSLAAAAEPPARAADLYRQLKDAAVTLDGWDDVQRGHGIVHELP